MSPKARLIYSAGLLIFGFVSLFAFAGCGSANTIYVCPNGSQQTTPCSTPTPVINNASSPVTGSTQPPGPTTAPVNNDPTNGDGQEFPGTVNGPAIVEYWTGEVNSNNQAINCGVFRLYKGQSFTWNARGHYWTYASDAAVNANWDGHVASYTNKVQNGKQINALCTGRSQPST